MTENELQDLRRAKLVAYVEAGGGAAKVGRDKHLVRSWESQYAQIKSGGSFGSRAARNLELKLKLPSLYFEPDTAEATAPTNTGWSKPSESMKVLGTIEPSEAQSNVEDAPPLKATRLIPVVGEVKGGDDGFLEELQYPVGHGEGCVDYPTTDSAAYALRVRGDSMHPRYRAGEFIVVTPSTEAQPSDDVVVALKDGRKLLKVLNWIQDGEVQLLSVNNHFAPLTLQIAEIEFVHLVDGRVRRSAFHRG